MPKLKKVELRNFRLERIIKDVAEQCPLIQDLHLYGHRSGFLFISIQSVYNVIGGFKNLRKLRLEAFTLMESKFLSNCVVNSNLESLEFLKCGMNWCFPDILHNVAPSLSELKVDRWEPFDGSVGNLAHAHEKSLKKLVLDCSNLSEEDIRSVRWFTNLEILYLDEAENCTDSIIKEFVGLKQLRKLRFECAFRVSKHAWEYLFSELVGLERISLFICENVDEECAKTICASCRDLKRLKIRNCPVKFTSTELLSSLTTADIVIEC